MNFQIVIVDPKKELPWNQELYNKEIDYNGELSRTLVATVNHKLKIVRPMHGYYAPHPTGKQIVKYAKSLGYEYKG
jgi:hypothetical protein